MKTGIQIAAIASILIAGAGAFWVFGQRSPMTVDMPETAAAIEVANIRPGMQVSAADLVALGDGWQAGLNSGHRIADSGLMRADRMYSRLSDDTIEALGID